MVASLLPSLQTGTITAGGNSLYYVEYTTSGSGWRTLSVQINSADVSESPYPIYVAPSDAAVGVIVAVVILVVAFTVIIGYIVYKRKQVQYSAQPQPDPPHPAPHPAPRPPRPRPNPRPNPRVLRPLLLTPMFWSHARTQIKTQQKEWARKKAAAYKEYQVDGTVPVPLAAQQNSKEPEWEDQEHWDEGVLQVWAGSCARAPGQETARWLTQPRLRTATRHQTDPAEWEAMQKWLQQKTGEGVEVNPESFMDDMEMMEVANK